MPAFLIDIELKPAFFQIQCTSPISYFSVFKNLSEKRGSISRSGHSTTVDDRIASARGCEYYLMRASLHGKNGGNPRVSLSLWSAYVLPRLIMVLTC